MEGKNWFDDRAIYQELIDKEERELLAYINNASLILARRKGYTPNPRSWINKKLSNEGL